MSALPTGTVTFLFTDIEGSTSLWQRDPEAMKLALERHHTLLRDAIQAHNGYVFQIVGDAFCAAFHTAPDAVAAAVRGQRALATEVWTTDTPVLVRMAIHTGAAEVEAGAYRSGEYISGPTLNRVSRLLAAAHGGQMLVSATTEPLVRDGLSESVRLHDLGVQRLRDLPIPARIFQVVVSGLRDAFPPLRSLAVVANNLPAQLTSFVGRERELAELRRLVTETRLLTVTGAGGSGKTRLCVELAASVVEEYPDGVWLAEFGALSDPALIAQVVAASVGVREDATRPLLATIVEHLRARRALLVLDNCEHVLDASAALVDGLVRGCPSVSIVVNSREPLGMTGEKVFRVPSLSLPSAAEHVDPERLAQYDAVRLFVDRARAVKADFTVAATNAAAVAEICRRLDGIPLAIELAAARMKALSVLQINTHLNERFRLLTGGSRAALPRQQTLRGLIDWSHGLLSPSEAVLFRRLSVFVGGWTIEAVLDVTPHEELDPNDVLDLLTRLVDKSLVVMDEHTGDARYRMLESIRQYGLEKLADDADVGRLRDRHREYFLGLAEAGSARLQGTEQLAWLSRLEADHDNLRAAVQWSLDHDDLERALRFGAALWLFWDMRGHIREAREVLDAILARAEGHSVSSLPPAAQRGYARVLDGVAVFRARRGEFPEALDMFQRSVATWRALGDSGGLAEALNTLGDHHRLMGDRASAKLLIEESLALFRSVSDSRGIAHALNNLAPIFEEEGDHDGARGLYEESLPLFRRIGDKRGLCHALANLGDALIRGARGGDAERLHRESLQLGQELDDWHAIATALRGLGAAVHSRGDHVEAIAFYEDAIARFRAMNDRTCLGRSLMDFAAAVYDADHERAWTYADEGMTLLRETHSVAYLLARMKPLADAALAGGELSRAGAMFAEAFALQSHRDDRAGVLATVADLARTASALREPERLATLLGAWHALRERCGLAAPSPDSMIDAAREDLGSPRFQARWDEGAAMTMEQLTAYVARGKGI